MKIKRIIMMLALVLVFGNIGFADSISTDRIDKGIVGVSFSDNSGKAYKVLVVKDGDPSAKVSYPLFPNGQTDYFPLTRGNGDYTVALLVGAGNGKYAFLEKKTVTLNLQDESVIYLNSIQNIEWTPEDDAIKYALNLAKDQSSAKAAFEMFYKYMTETVMYDFQKASSVKGDYVPSISKTFVDSKGICYDYSSMFAAFMRSKGVPTRLVKGYTPNVGENIYHAWNEVLIEGKWMVVDTTLDAGMKKFDVQFKPADQYRKVHDY